MKQVMGYSLGVFLAASALATPAVRTIWDPARTYVFAVGVLQWQRAADWTSFESRGRRDAELVDLFVKSGVPQNHVVYLQDRAATLAKIRAGLDGLLQRVTPRDTLLLYYCGHGFVEKNSTYLANFDAGEKAKSWWPIKEVVETLERKFRGARCAIVIDCCHSGALVEEIRRVPRRVSYGAFTSSSALESSTGNWTFTQAILDGLRGNPLLDLDGDGRITASEVAKYAGEEMGIFEEQLATSHFTGKFGPDSVLAVTTGKRLAAPVGQRVSVRYDKDLWSGRVVDVRGAKVRVRWVTIGYDKPENDEWLARSDLRPIKVTRFPVGAKVQVKWKLHWYPATVLAAQGGIHRIHYQDYDSDWDEWVPSKRVR